MDSLLFNLNEILKNFEFERRRINELDQQKKYKITFAKIIKSKFGNAVLVGLDEKISTFLPKKYSELIRAKNVEELCGLYMGIELVTESDGRHNVFLNFSKE